MSDGDRELAEIVLRNTKRMNDTVNNVLELSRRVPPALESIDVSESHLLSDRILDRANHGGVVHVRSCMVLQQQVQRG